jgi:hypothetical protein
MGARLQIGGNQTIMSTPTAMRGRGRLFLAALFFPIFLLLAPVVFADNPREIAFPAENPRFVRLVITASTSGSEPCVDELEVYGADEQKNLALYSNFIE